MEKKEERKVYDKEEAFDEIREEWIRELRPISVIKKKHVEEDL